MKRSSLARWLAAIVVLYSCAAAAQRATPLLVTREAQDLYRVELGGSFYMKTKNCYENVYSDRVGLHVNTITRGGMLNFRNGKACVVEKFLTEIEPSKLNLKKDLF